MASSKLRTTRAPMLPFAIPAGVPFDAFAPSMIPNHGLVVRGPADRVHPSDRSGTDVSPRPSCCASRVARINCLWDAELRTGTPLGKNGGPRRIFFPVYVSRRSAKGKHLDFPQVGSRSTIGMPLASCGTRVFAGENPSRRRKTLWGRY